MPCRVHHAVGALEDDDVVDARGRQLDGGAEATEPGPDDGDAVVVGVVDVVDVLDLVVDLVLDGVVVDEELWGRELCVEEPFDGYHH